MSVPPTALAIYDQPHQFEPLLPQKELEALALRSRDVVEQSLRLQGTAHASTRKAIAELVRSMNSYYSNLIEGQSTHPKDMSRHGDLGGRGNLSETMLRAWCEYFIGTCQDQVTFMGRMLELEGLKERMAGLIAVRSKEAGQSYREDAILPMHHVIAAGPTSRGDFNRMLGLGERTGRTVIAQLLKDGLLVSDTPKGELRLGLPLNALNILLPNFYPEASTHAID